jgi:hypothetical protein
MPIVGALTCFHIRHVYDNVRLNVNCIFCVPSFSLIRYYYKNGLCHSFASRLCYTHYSIFLVLCFSLYLVFAVFSSKYLHRLGTALLFFLTLSKTRSLSFYFALILYFFLHAMYQEEAICNREIYKNAEINVLKLTIYIYINYIEKNTNGERQRLI